MGRSQRRHRNYRRLYAGLALAAAAGMIFGHAWTGSSYSWWIVGSATLCSGLMLIISGIYAREQPRRGTPPQLGELLIRKYHLITERDLAEALARQHYSKRRLGQILIEMGLITPVQLVDALEDQLSQTPPKG